MARQSWLDESSQLPLIDEQVSKLDHFVSSLADGIIQKDELEKQQQALAEAMKAVEGDLSDELHEKVTRLLVELTAYNIMNTLHELASQRLRRTFK